MCLSRNGLVPNGSRSRRCNHTIVVLIAKRKKEYFLLLTHYQTSASNPSGALIAFSNTAHWQVWFHEGPIHFYTWGGKVDNLLSHIIRYCTWRQGYIYVTTHEQLGRHPSVPMNYNEAPPGPTKHHQAHSFGLPGERWGCLCVALAVPVFANQRKDFSKKYEQN